jgi:hypothetical protein
VVGVETLFDGVRRQSQRLPPHGRLERFQIQIPQTLTPQQRFNVPQNLSGEKAVE